MRKTNALFSIQRNEQCEISQHYTNKSPNSHIHTTNPYRPQPCGENSRHLVPAETSISPKNQLRKSSSVQKNSKEFGGHDRYLIERQMWSTKRIKPTPCDHLKSIIDTFNGDPLLPHFTNRHVKIEVCFVFNFFAIFLSLSFRNTFARTLMYLYAFKK